LPPQRATETATQANVAAVYAVLIFRPAPKNAEPGRPVFGAPLALPSIDLFTVSTSMKLEQPVISATPIRRHPAVLSRTCVLLLSRIDSRLFVH